MESHPYIEISINILRAFDVPLVFDVYVKRTEDSYTKIFKCDDILDTDRLELYSSKGVKFFYVSKNDYYNYTLYVERLGRKMAQAGLTSVGVVEPGTIISEMLNLTIYEVSMQTGIDQRVLNVSKHIVSTALQAIEQDKSQMIKIFKMLADKPYYFKHATMVSIFSIIIAKANKFESLASLELIGLAGMMHDIGKGLLTFDPSEVEHFSTEQRAEYERHPELGKRMLDSVAGISKDVKRIVLEHHERPNGTGFPNALISKDIFIPSKIVSLANAFATLITKKSWRSALSVEEAFKYLKTEVGVYDGEVLNNFIKFTKKL